MAYIYLITNKLNNKQYVGQCMCNIQERFMAHYSDSNRTIPLHNDMHEFGIDNFIIELLDECADDIRLDVETYYIDKCNTIQPNGYNVWRHSSDGFSGKHHSDKSRAAISQRSLDWWASATDEQKSNRNNKIREKLSGRKFSDEHRQKLSAIASQRTGSKNPFYGKHHTVEQIQKLQAAKQKYIYIQFDVSGVEIARFNSIHDAARAVLDTLALDLKLASIEHRIREVCYGKSKIAYGFRWSMILKSSGECNDYSNGDEISQ